MRHAPQNGVPGVNRFEDLIAWQLENELRREVVAFTETGKAARDFKYRDQIRDAVSSAARNTAEGFGRFRPDEFARFLEFVHGSLKETQDALIDGRDREYLDREAFERMWRLTKRALAANRRLMLYLKDCAAKGLEPWLDSGKELPPRERATPRTRNPRT